MKSRLIGCLVVVAAAALADVKLPALISDHMVVQSGVPVRIWGWAEPGEAVTVSFAGQSPKTTANAAGKWEAFLNPVKAGTAGTLAITGKNKLTVADVLAGEVWVASGQSNMEWPLNKTNDADKEVADANYPQLRFFLVKKAVSETPKDDVEAKWVVCTPANMPQQSAVAYFFAREINQTQKVPVGVINSYWGGTPAQSWTSMPKLRDDAAVKFYLDQWDGVVARYPEAKTKFDEAYKKWAETKTGNAPGAPQGPGHPNTPAGLYNAMIAPLTPYTIRGAIWYQGESNASEAQAYNYRRLFGDMIEDWRQNWGIGDFPFYFVQLANFKTNGWWPLLRESQTATLGMKNTAMAVTIDIGNPANIHPTDKQDVGHRLALAARAQVFDEKIVFSGPMYKTMTVENGKVRVWFDHPGTGLAARGGGQLKGFEVAGPDGKFVPADASIDGLNVLVSSASIAEPTAVRYAWTDNPEEANLINKENLPASPFRNKQGREK